MSAAEVVLCGCGEVATVDCDERGWRCDDCVPASYPCCECGKPTTWDETYEDLCYRCCRADNE